MINFFDIGAADEAVIEFISQVEACKDVFITRGGKPVALIIKFEVESREEFVELNYDAAKGLIPEWTDEEWERSDELMRKAWREALVCDDEEELTDQV